MRGLSWLLGFVATCQLACWAQAADMGSLDSTEPLRVGLLRDSNFPFSQPAQTSVPANHAGLEGFEVRTIRFKGCREVRSKAGWRRQPLGG